MIVDTSPYKFKDWVPIEKIVNSPYLSLNPKAIFYLQQHPERINWYNLSQNPNAVFLLEQNLNKVNWEVLLIRNPNSKYLIEKNLDRICNLPKDVLVSNPYTTPVLEVRIKELTTDDWIKISENPEAIPLIKKNLHKVNWDALSRNPGAIDILSTNRLLITWSEFKKNPKAMSLVEMNPYSLSLRRKAIEYIDRQNRKREEQRLRANNLGIEYKYSSFYLERLKLINRHTYEIDWEQIDKQPEVLEWLESREGLIDWYSISWNPKAMSLIERNLDKISWQHLLEGNTNPDRFRLLEDNYKQFQQSIDLPIWVNLWKSPGAIKFIKENLEYLSPSQAGYYLLAENPEIFELT